MPAVCILGGGYAGLRVARELRGRLGAPWTIMLVDRGTCHQLITCLPETVVGKVGSQAACVPFSAVLGTRVQHLRADVRSVDLAGRRVATSAGPIHSDVLVIALGTSPDYLDVPGAREHAFALKSIQDAVTVRDRIAELRSQRSIVRVVIVGAGYTGTEVAGELTAPDYEYWAGDRGGTIEVRIVAEDTRLLPQASPRLGLAVESILRHRRIPIHLGQAVLRMDESKVTTIDGAEFPSDVVVWAGQTGVAFNFIRGAGGEASVAKLRTDPYLHVGNDESIFACGDAASVFDYERDTVAASSAQLAVQEGETVARNIVAHTRGEALVEYRPRVLGEALGLGGRDAVAEVGGVILTGRAAAAVKRAALVRYLSSLTFPPNVGSKGFHRAQHRQQV